jgi:hypothetical protein
MTERETQLFISNGIPNEFWNTLNYMAYERGHAYGEEEVFNILVGLVSDFAPAFKKYKENQVLVGDIDWG